MFLYWDWNFIIYVWYIKQYCVGIKIIFSKPLMIFISTYSGKITRKRRWSHVGLMTLHMCCMIVFRLYLFIFNWRITALQSLVGFPHTTTKISHKYIIHSLVSLPPTSHHPTLYVVTELPAGLPMLYSNFPLASYFAYGSGYVSKLLSQFVPASSPAEFTGLSSTSVYLFSSVEFSSVQFSGSVVSDSLQHHESQHARPPCPSLTPRFTETHVHWVSDTI